MNFSGTAAPGELVDVEIEGATSTTLRGTQRALVLPERSLSILLTGSSGQIGTNLALRLLRDGHRVCGVDKRVNTWTDEFKTLSRTSQATTRRFRAASTASSTRRSTSSCISPHTRRCTSSSASRTGRSRTR